MIERTHHMVVLPDLPAAANGLRVIQLTDIHRSRLTSDRIIRHAVALANIERPDLIVLTGDFVTNQTSDIEPCVRILAQLRARLGVYAILGNHDYTTDPMAVEHALLRRNIHLLKNHNIVLENGLRLVGLDDDHFGRTDVARAFGGVRKDEFALILVHNPGLIDLVADRNCLALAGHTHGGQMAVPWVTAWAVRRIGAKHYRSGWYRVGNAELYVNRGLGRVGFPIRFRSRPEMAVFTLVSGKAERYQIGSSAHSSRAAARKAPHAQREAGI